MFALQPRGAGQVGTRPWKRERNDAARRVLSLLRACGLLLAAAARLLEALLNAPAPQPEAPSPHLQHLDACPTTNSTVLATHVPCHTARSAQLARQESVRTARLPRRRAAERRGATARKQWANLILSHMPLHRLAHTLIIVNVVTHTQREG